MNIPPFRPFSRTGGLGGVRHFPIEWRSIIIGCQMVHGYVEAAE